MAKDKQNNIYAIANDKDGRFFQYLISTKNGLLTYELSREFKVPSQPEGCVSDDINERLFVGEENHAVWTLDARAEQPAKLDKVMAVGDKLHDDIEGISIYQNGDHSYIVVSSQGNNSYVVLDAHAPYKYRGRFEVGLNAEKGIDGASETDGLDVSSANMGGIWSQGMLVVQDGRNRMPATEQNFKYIAWSQIAQALNLD
jgi:3-phytase